MHSTKWACICITKAAVKLQNAAQVSAAANTSDSLHIWFSVKVLFMQAETSCCYQAFMTPPPYLVT